MLDLNRCLSVFLHELKSPLNSILGIVEIAKKEGIKEEHLEQIRAITEYMLALSCNLLQDCNENRISDKEVFCLRQVGEDVVKFFQSQSLLKRIDFRFEADEGASREVFGEALKLKQILINILANAFKFTKESGKIEIFIKTEPAADVLKTEFTIRDNGVGMSPEFLKRIFHPYEREDENEDGTGLGLSIVKDLIQRMGGSIGVKSVKGKGSEFVINFTFPYGERKKPDFHMKRILVADDSFINLEIVKSFLVDAGAEIEVATDGKTAIDKFAHSQEDYFDLILMDLRMPGLSGCEATRAIRSLERDDAKEIAIIGFSANSLDEDVFEALECGMNDYLCKPVAVDKLYQMLSKYL